jgi:hypothetical protein
MDEGDDVTARGSSDGADHYGLRLVVSLVVTIVVGILAGPYWRMLLEGLTVLGIVVAIIVGFVRLKS